VRFIRGGPSVARTSRVFLNTLLVPSSGSARQARDENPGRA